MPPTNSTRRAMSRAAMSLLGVTLFLGACSSAEQVDFTSTESAGSVSTSAAGSSTTTAGGRAVGEPSTSTGPTGEVTTTATATTGTQPATSGGSDPSTTAGATSTTTGGPSGDPSSTSSTVVTATTSGSPGTTSSSTSTTSTSTTTTTSAPAPPPDRIELPAAVASTEGVAADASTSRLFVGELSNGNVWVGDLTGDPFTLFASGAAAGRATALGMAVDEGRRRLYVASPANARVDVLDVDSGTLLTSIGIPEAAGTTVNDVAVAPDGTVYVTDTGKPRVYRIAPGGSSAEVWVDYTTSGAVDTARSQHGNGVVANGSHVLVAYMETGELLRIDRTSRAVDTVAIAGATTAGRDGLVRCGNRLFGVDINSLAGGTDTAWVTQLAGDWSSGSHVTALRPAGLSSASTAALLDGSLVIVNAQFGVAPKVTPFWLTVVNPSGC